MVAAGCGYPEPATARHRKKFMQNYRVSSPVNGGSDVVAVCNSGGQIELFTIGSDGNIHTFFPDSSSETGYNETTITTGLQATALAAGIDSQGKVIVFAASLPGPVLYYTVRPMILLPVGAFLPKSLVSPSQLALSRS